jgi:OmcA/MtrC family decaheme c-type cytochrome
VGSGVAILEGHPSDASGAIPVRTGTLSFAITDATATPRRTVVDIQKCNQCHGMLSVHGGNRTDSIETCVACHNSEATDVTQRSGTSVDGKAEQSIAFATMIHSIHSGATPYSPGIVIYSYTGKPAGSGTPAPIDFRSVVLPEGNSVGKCAICHTDPNPMPSAETGMVNGITQVTGDTATQDTYSRTSKTAALCSSCHGTALAAQHMSQNGAGFGLSQLAIDNAQNAPSYGPGAETCTLCHAKGALFDPALFHGH